MKGIEISITRIRFYLLIKQKVYDIDAIIVGAFRSEGSFAYNCRTWFQRGDSPGQLPI
jgi:hypothetical protein